MAKYIIYKGNKYIKVDSAHTMVDKGNNGRIRDAVDSACNFLQRSVARELTPWTLGLTANIKIKEASVDTTDSNYRDVWFTFEIESPVFDAGIPERGVELKKQMVANKGKVGEVIRRLCDKKRMKVKSINVEIEPFGYYKDTTYFYFITLNAAVDPEK